MPQKTKKKWNYPSPRMLARHHQNFSMFSFGNPNRKPGTCHDGILPRRLAPNDRAPCKSLKLTQAPRAPLHPKVNRTPLLGWWTEISRRSSFFSSPLFLSTPCFPSPQKKKMYLKGFFFVRAKNSQNSKRKPRGLFFFWVWRKHLHPDESRITCHPDGKKTCQVRSSVR